MEAVSTAVDVEEAAQDRGQGLSGYTSNRADIIALRLLLVFGAFLNAKAGEDGARRRMSWLFLM